MGAIVKLTIAGLEVPAGRYGDHAFFRPLGVNAPEMTWCLPTYIADAVLKLEWTEITILQQGASTPKVFKRVKVVREAPSDHPFKRYVVLSDARWPFPRTYVKENYNLRTASAQTELLKVDGVPLEIDPVKNIVTYAPSSLKGGLSAWTADDILDDILRRRLGVNFTRLARSLGDYAPNDVQIDGPGNVALSHAMSAVGGLDIRVNDDGDIELVDAMLGAERDTIIKNIPYSLRSKGMMRWVSLALVAPISVEVGYDADVEVRGDGILPSAGSAAGSWPTMDNVIQVVDKQLPTTDPVTGKGYLAVQGSYLPADQWFDAVAADTVVPAPPVPSGVRWTRLYAHFDYLRGLMESWFVTSVLGGLEPSPTWGNRYRAYREHLFKTWRLNPAFARLCLPGSIRAVRAQLLDPANNTRQPSAVYMDYARKPSIRGTRDDKAFGWNIHCIPGSPTTQKMTATKTYSDGVFPGSVFPLGQGKQAPVLVQCTDDIAGIFRFGFKKDVHDHTAELVPCLVQRLPTNDLDAVNRGAGIAYWEQAELIQTQRCALVFTATPTAAPLYFVSVTPQQALDRLKVNVQINPKGPKFQLRTGPMLQTARIAYQDTQRQNVQNLFEAKDRAAAAALLQALVPVNLEILKDYAIAQAATLYAAMLDHFQGECEVEFRPDAMPQGSLQDVIHTVTTTGRCYTKFVCKRVTPPVQPIHFMERGARAVIFRNPGNFQ